ncbi:type IV toxin-antitoxin system AbiEi family antitoxin domain-containing protein [Trueperella bialowiezensis]|uniref:AbiEi antitoxin N-terminal domain-containing protein n=1 Tax=Trueperella bialowiezensis TaxID=312285 RepID=A0A3S4VTR9_9ACTO|nr:type IV toxin-antitoxin system AbiEi family antitoxin domain-containing protein [Trueperella bialowiezensis]VEI13544.1 Uncharacterised protein [Trueperella bialowiezensis]
MTLTNSNWDDFPGFLKLPYHPDASNLNLGVFHRDELKVRGLSTDYRIRKALKSGKLIRLGRGYYAVPGANQDVAAAVAAGRRIGCLSACKLYGIWVPPDSGIHHLMSVGAKAPKNRAKSNNLRDAGERNRLYVHRLPALGKEIVPSLVESLRQVCRFHDAETGLIVLESALNQGLIGRVDMPEIICTASVEKQRILRRANGRSESGSETRLKNFFESLGVKVEQQVRIPGVGRVDMLIGLSQILECDSHAFHSKAYDYHRDRQRDLIASTLGYHTARLSYRHVWETWPQTQDYLHKIIRTRRHMKPPKPLR